MTAQDVITGNTIWSVEQADCLTWFASQPADSVDLVFGSPPYERARTYGIDFALAGEEWVAWMVKVFQAALRVSRGLVAFVVEGQTRKYRWSATPVLLMADLHRAGIHLRRPIFFHRVGIPGSGGPDWVRGDTEFIVCATRGGKLPFSDNTACGHPPKWAPGGEMAHRLKNGQRVNQWGPVGGKRGGGGRNTDGTPKASALQAKIDGHPTHEIVVIGEPPDEGVFRVNERKKDGTRKPKKRLGRNMANGVEGSTKGSCQGRRVPRGHEHNGEILTEDAYLPPVLANPGNVVWDHYTSQQVVELLAVYENGDLKHCSVGGGVMGHPLAHENEAPFPVDLAAFFVCSFAPEDGIVADCFAGSGTTGHAALKWGRRFIGCDVRQRQAELTGKRLKGETDGQLFA